MLNSIYSKYKAHINLSFGAGVLILLLYGILQMFVINILTFAYLTFKTITILQQETPENDTLIHALKNWICYACYIMLETVGDFAFQILPFSFIYYFSKMFLFLWILRSDDNSEYVYDKFIHYFYEKYHFYLNGICNLLEGSTKKYREIMDEYSNNYYMHARGVIIGYIKDLIREKILDLDMIGELKQEISKNKSE